MIFLSNAPIARYVIAVVSVPFSISDTNTRVKYCGQERSDARRWDCEEVPGRAREGGSRSGPI